MSSFFFAKRLSLGNDARHLTPAVKVATIAVALSVAVMIAAVAIVMGFKQQITDKIVGFNSHISIQIVPAEGEDNILLLSNSLSQLLDSVPYITDYSASMSAPAVIKTAEDFKGVYLHSAAELRLHKLLSESLEEGIIPEFDKVGTDSLIVLSEVIANKLDLKCGDNINIYFLTDEVKVRRMKISGIINSHFDAYDNIYVYGSPSLLREIAGLQPNQCTSIVVNTDDFNRLDEYTADLQTRLNDATQRGYLYRAYSVDNAIKAGGSFFQWLELLDMNVIVVLVIMLLVGCVTLVSGMLIIIADKKHFIALMKSLGAGNGLLSKIFLLLSMRVALVGMAIGNIFIIAILYIQYYYHLIPLDPESYYIDFVPVKISWLSIVLLNIGVITIAYFVLILPSRFVGRISPAESMKS